MKRAALYLRVSRSDQDVRMQRDEVLGLISRRGFSPAIEYLDDGASGATHHRRPSFHEMLRDAKRGRFDVLVVYKGDRLFRSLGEFISTLAELAELGIEFVSVTEPFDTSTPSGRLLLQMVAAFAEFERSLLIERTNHGLDAARRRGVKLGRRKVVVDVELARALRAQGLPYSAIGERLGVGTGTVYRALVAVPETPRNDAS